MSLPYLYQAVILRDQWDARRKQQQGTQQPTGATAGDLESTCSTGDVIALSDVSVDGEGAIDDPMAAGVAAAAELGGSRDAAIVDAAAAAVTAVVSSSISGEEASKANKLQQFIETKLPECYNKQRADEFAAGFCYYPGKNARKRLVAALLKVPKGRSELPSTYSRIISTLARVYPDVAPPVVDALRKEFFGMLKSKNQFNIDSKVRNVRYLAELVKFTVAPPILALRMFKALLADFSLSPHNVELLAVLLESCGRSDIVFHCRPIFLSFSLMVVGDVS